MKEDILLGIERLKSFKNKSEHYKNLNLIGEITPKIALLELILRNLLDFYLSEENKDWIFADEFKDFRKDTLKKYKNKDLSKYQYLSNLTLGQVVRIIRAKKLQKHFARLFKIRSFSFTALSPKNADRAYIRGRKVRLPDVNKINIFLSLFVTLRNRSFHFENLLKLRNDKPRISAFYSGLVVGLHPSKIEFFLEYFINIANKELLKSLEENSPFLSH